MYEKLDTVKKNIGIAGTGKMGEALITGLLKAKILPSEKLYAYDIDRKRSEYISKKYGIPYKTSNVSLAKKCSVLIVAVKPYDVKKVLENIKNIITTQHLIISLAAGISIDYIKKILKKKAQIVRVMPNTPVLVGEGMTAINYSEKITRENKHIVEKIFASVGKTAILDSEHINAATAISGSGPAYIYMIIEALADVGVKVGLPRDLATLLASQTTLGSAKMVLETQEHPAKLKDMVTTPGGVAAEGLYGLERGNLRSTISEAVLKANQRAKELTK